MFGQVAAFEFRYQLRNPVFWVAALVFFFMGFGAVASENISLGAGGSVHKNAPVALAIGFLFLSLFYMFVTSAFVANVVVRDDDSGFAPIARATPVSKFDYLIGRFAGAFGAAALAYFSIALGFIVGTLMPWVDPEVIGPNRLGWYLGAYVLFGLPNVFITAALLFAVATVARSMAWTYLAVIALFIGYVGVNNAIRRQPQGEPWRTLFDPFGTAPLREAIRYWTATESNSQLPPMDGWLLWNRLLSMGIALLVLAAAYWLFRPEARSRKARKRDVAMAAPAPPPPALGAVGVLPAPRFGAATGWRQFWARLRFEMASIARNPAFPVLLVLGVAFGGLMLFQAGSIYGTQVWPVTRVVIETLGGGFTLVPLIVAIYFGGDIVWRDRERGCHEITGASSVPGWAFAIPKMLALLAMLFATLLAAVLAGVALQAAQGYTNFEPGKYLWWFVARNGAFLALIAVLSVFVQTLAPSKPVGWAIMGAYLVSGFALPGLGLEHNLYQYAGGPNVPLSDMNGQGHFAAAQWWFLAYWGALALAMAALTHLLWRRGADVSLKPRLAALPRRLRGPAGAVVAAGLAAFVGLGAWIFHNTNVLNEYRTSDDFDARAARMEKELLRFENVPQPTVTRVAYRIDLRPRDLGMATDGAWTIENRTNAPLGEVHLWLPSDTTRLERLTVEGGAVAREFPDLGYRIFRLATPMRPGETRAVTFRTVIERRGFTNQPEQTGVVWNGSFVNNRAFAPMLGMSRLALLTDRAKRRKYGLPAELRPRGLDDPLARTRNYINADWVWSDITVTTDADQTPVAPGDRVSDVTANGRRTARFVAQAPILNFLAVQSARYQQRSRVHDGVTLRVFHDAQHPYNVDRMLAAMAAALDYFQPAFGPYQFKEARIIEFPAYATFAQAFAGTMPYSEGIGFIARVEPEKIDYVTYVTAHEMAHQWWAHQVVGADAEGSTALSETLAQYSALMVMERLYGPDRIRRFLKYELDRYLRDRGSDPVGERPLMLNRNQGYIHYRKGSLVMYLLRDRVGEAAVNRALRGLVTRFRFKGAPYPTSRDLVAALRAEAGPENQALITDLFERITLYDAKVTDAAATKRADGRYDVAVTVAARKLYSDEKGEETEAPLNEAFDIGLFTGEPGKDAFNTRDVLLFRTVPLHSGAQVFRFVTARAPTFAGIDPYNKRIDRNSDDNLKRLAD